MKKSLSIQRSFRMHLGFGGQVSVGGLLLLLFISNFSFAQNPLVKQWDYRFGGTGVEFLHCFLQTADGGFILAGQSNSGVSGNKTQTNWGGDDYWIVKLDSLGNHQWDKDFGGTLDDELWYLKQTHDRGFILGGGSKSGANGDKTEPCQGSWDYWVIKIDSSGNS